MSNGILDIEADLLKIARPVTRAAFDPDATYLLVGCLGGLGRSLSAWMVEKGARHLAFLSRSGINKSEAVSIVEELTVAGAQPEVIQCNVTDQNALASAVEKLSATRQVKGVIHAAMVEGVSFQRLTNKRSAVLTRSRMRSSKMPLGPKYRRSLSPRSWAPSTFIMPQRVSHLTFS